MPRNKWIFFVVISLFLSDISALTRTVDINGTGQYTSIQSAVTASSPGDTVLVYPGRYYENVNLSINNLILVSLEYSTNDQSFILTTIIDGGLNSSGIRINQNIQNIGVRGFSITNSKSGISMGENSSSTITNCYIYENASAYGGGINVYKCTTVLRGLCIYDNYAYIMGGGMYINGYMGTVSASFDPVNLCSIYNNTAGAGQDIVAHSINGDLDIPLQMFTVANPTSYYAAPYRAWGSDFQLNISSVEAHHQEVNSDLYVSPNGDDSNDGLSSASALKTIKTAIYRVASDSLNTKTVHILPGTYSISANQQIFPISLKSWVKLQGAGVDATQMIGKMDPSYASVQYNSLKVFTSCYQTNASLEDMSITSEGSDNSCAIWGHKEDNLHLKNLRMHDLSPDQSAVINIAYAINTLWDNVIIENIATDGYGFVSCQGYLSGVIRNCTFRNGVNTFVSSEVWGDALFWVSVGESLIVENSIFTNLTMADDNSQAISIGTVPDPTFQQYYTLRNCLFSNISCNERGVLIVGNAYPIMEITNCTFAGHTGNGEALMVNGNVTISNSIFYNERSVEIAINPMDGTGIPTTLTLNNNLIRNGYSDIWQGPGSTINYSDTNITGNPLFLEGVDIHDPLYYSLFAGSPCINAGTSDTLGLNLPPYDLAGNWRIWNGRIDIGCFEYGSEPWVTNDDPISPALANVINATNYPNPFNPSTTIDFSLPLAGVATLEIYNLKGQKVRQLLNSNLPSGSHKAVWDGINDFGQPVSSGIYFYRVNCNKQAFTGKMILAK
ncbi:MAG: T9SS type A sorting domain-containing protein [Candidatus Cloacimonetes bacterium]|nr:T9SS type A sorting domain-containing protein [Candidatus Cloacimonadota bacterium]